jgi:hypothetical protein
VNVTVPAAAEFDTENQKPSVEHWLAVLSFGRFLLGPTALRERLLMKEAFDERAF